MKHRSLRAACACLSFLLFSAAFLGGAAYMHRAAARPAVADAGGELTFVLDAGHGGEDGGAVGVNGVYEKDLNLRIAMTLGQLLEEAGHTVVYTRTEDRLLYTAEQDIRGKRKMYDLRNRLATAEAQPNAVLISIHMNKFSSARYSGLQVYYSGNHADSRILADRIQNTVKADLQPENNRAIKAADENIYLLHHATIPAVLIECGFLSHAEECAKLSTADYQKALSFSIFCGIMEYIERSM